MSRGCEGPFEGHRATPQLPEATSNELRRFREADPVGNPQPVCWVFQWWPSPHAWQIGQLEGNVNATHTRNQQDHCKKRANILEYEICNPFLVSDNVFQDEKTCAFLCPPLDLLGLRLADKVPMKASQMRSSSPIGWPYVKARQNTNRWKQRQQQQQQQPQSQSQQRHTTRHNTQHHTPMNNKSKNKNININWRQPGNSSIFAYANFLRIPAATATCPGSLVQHVWHGSAESSHGHLKLTLDVNSQNVFQRETRFNTFNAAKFAQLNFASYHCGYQVPIMIKNEIEPWLAVKTKMKLTILFAKFISPIKQ